MDVRLGLDHDAVSASCSDWDRGQDVRGPRPCADNGMCRRDEFHWGGKGLVEDPCHVLHVECDWARDGSKAEFYPFGLGELEHGGGEEVRVDLSGVAISGHRGVRVGEGFLDPAQVVWEAFSFPLFHI